MLREQQPACSHEQAVPPPAGVHALMPPIEVVEGSICNADPENPAEWEVSGGRPAGRTQTPVLQP